LLNWRRGSLEFVPDSKGRRREKIAGLTARIGSVTRNFRFDTGATNTFLTVGYLEEHRKDFAGQPMTKSEIGRTGGAHAVPAYMVKSVTITLGGVPVTLNDIAVLAARRRRSTFTAT
jgi:hypothetical protein